MTRFDRMSNAEREYQGSRYIGHRVQVVLARRTVEPDDSLRGVVRDVAVPGQVMRFRTPILILDADDGSTRWFSLAQVSDLEPDPQGGEPR